MQCTVICKKNIQVYCTIQIYDVQRFLWKIKYSLSFFLGRKKNKKIPVYYIYCITVVFQDDYRTETAVIVCTNLNFYFISSSKHNTITSNFRFFV
jgi:hypothetical protein